MILSAFTLFHVVISVLGIGSGFVVMYGLIVSKSFDSWTKLFLATTVATSVTGFMFPVHKFMPSHAVGILSLIVLAIAIPARYRYGMKGAWRPTYVVTSSIALYFNVFVLIVQLFQKVPALQALAPTQSESPFKIAQLLVLLMFASLTVVAAVKFHTDPTRTATSR